MERETPGRKRSRTRASGETGSHGVGLAGGHQGWFNSTLPLVNEYGIQIQYEPLKLLWFDNRGVCYHMSAQDRAPKPHKEMEPWARTLFRACLLRILEELNDATT